MKDKLIVIVGFMGCGKTAVGKELGRLLNTTFIDLDSRIEDIEERTPAQIIREDGEHAFREKETSALRDLLGDIQQSVIALGGGAWTIAVNRELIRSVPSIVIWLDAPFDTCWERIEHDASLRPMAPSRSAAEKLFAGRMQFYRLADLQLRVTTESPKQTAENIAALLQQQSHT